MTLLFVDGFDHYVTADINKKWTSSSNSIISTTVTRRAGSSSLSSNSTGASAIKTISASSTLITGFGYYCTALAGSEHTIVAFQDTGTSQITLTARPDGTLAVKRGNSAGTLLGSTTYNINAATWVFLELKVTFSQTVGTVEVRANGATILSLSGIDTCNTANTTANGLYVSTGLQSPATYYFDDCYVCDGLGSTNNNFLGDIRVDTLFPTSDGNYTAFTPSTGSSHYVLVDETAPNTTDYNSGANVGDRDSYGLSNLSALSSQTVYGVQVNAALLKDDAGAKSASTFVRSNTTDGDGASTPLGTSLSYLQQVYELNPDGNVAWTETTVNAMEAGVRVTA